MQSTTLIPPTEVQIKDTVQDLKKILANPLIDLPINKRVKDGYSEALVILVNGAEDYSGYEHLTSVQARSIAEITLEYLKGIYSKAELLGVKLANPKQN